MATALEARLRSVPRARLIGTLLAAQICGSTGHSLTLAVGSISAADITGSNVWSGAPVAVGAVGAALAGLLLSRFMGSHGRRAGLTLGYSLAVFGSLLGMLAAVLRDFPLFLGGMALIGVGNGSNLLARFAAADVSPGALRGRAIGLVVWGSTAGSMLGPMLIALAVALGTQINLPPSGSPFSVGVLSFGLAASMIFLLLRPDPLEIARDLQRVEDADRAHEPARPVGRLLQLPRVRLALAALMTSQLVMIGTTSTSPVYLRDQGHHVHEIGLAVALHLGGMYAASPLTGWLCDRFGRLVMMGAGGLVLIGAVTFAALAPGSDSLLVSAALFMNGVGWNFAFVAGSALLTDSLTPAERPSLQGVADLLTGLMGALGSIGGGAILGIWGFGAQNAAGALLTLLPLIWYGMVGVRSQQSGVRVHAFGTGVGDRG
jgi:MFS family permease